MSPIHSIPASPQPVACESWVGTVRPRLRHHVLGYAGFRAGAGVAVRHRLLPSPFATVIVDLDAGTGLVTGARQAATVDGDTAWGHGVTFGLTPGGVSALLGVPMRELTGARVALPEMLGSRGVELVERLSAAPSWAARFAVLDDLLTRWAAPGGPPDAAVAEAWRRLQRNTGRPPAESAAGAGRQPGPGGLPGQLAAGVGREWQPGAGCLAGQLAAGVGRGWQPGAGCLADQLDAGVGRGSQSGDGRPPDPLVAAAWWRLQSGAGRVDAVARELGVSRRYLQEGFRRQIGLAPAAVARIARLQRAIHRLSRGSALQAAAVDSGYADQPHLTRSMRAMVGLTPGELCAFVQYPPPAAA